MSVDRLSAPQQPTRLPRELTPQEERGLLRSADILIPQHGEMPAASQAPDYGNWLTRALTARPESFDRVVAAAARLETFDDAALAPELRRMSKDEPELFQPLSAILAGAYLMVPEVREAIGYPGQERNHPRFDEAAEEIMDGILDPVIERGAFFTPA